MNTSQPSPVRSLVPSWFLPALAITFVLSGSSALIYQVIWLRLLGHVFGVTVYAASTVWASFMAGLAIGSYAAGRVADRVRRPLLWFAGAELGIGLSAMLTPLMLTALQRWMGEFGPVLTGNFALATVVRFGISFAVLLVPTVLMGATLPLVLRSSTFQPERLGVSSAALYASNTTGAIFGAMVAGLYFIPLLGMTTTFRIAGALNVAAATIAAALASRVATGSPANRVAAAAPDASLDTAASARWAVMITFAVSGAVSLALELIWLRLSTIILGPTVYVISLLLAGVLLGIAAGSYAVAPFLRKPRQPLLVLAVLETAIAVSTLMSLLVLTKVPSVSAALPKSIEGVIPPYIVPIVVASLMVAVPPMLLMGAAFPIGLHLWSSRADDPSASRFASRVGVFYSANVCGGIIGSLLTGFYLLPRFGGRTSLIMVSYATLATAVALILTTSLKRTTRLAAATATVIGFTLLVRSVPSAIETLLAIRHPGEPIIWAEEGVQTTASVHAFQNGRRRVLYLDGYHQADNTGGMAHVHHQIGVLPLAIHPNPRKALIVGLGGGATAGAMARAESVDITVVELSDTVVRSASFFNDINFDVLQRPNVHLLVDDGRNYLALTKERYDIITADAIQPIRAGAASLYSREYFELVDRALNYNGLALQWIGGTEAEWQQVARTFLSVFPNTTVWGNGTLLVGTKQPLQLDPADFAIKMEAPGYPDALRSIGLDRFEDLKRFFRAGPADLARRVGEGVLLTDDRPILEFFLSQPREGLDLSTFSGDIAPFMKH